MQRASEVSLLPAASPPPQKSYLKLPRRLLLVLEASCCFLHNTLGNQAASCGHGGGTSPPTSCACPLVFVGLSPKLVWVCVALGGSQLPFHRSS